MRAPAATTAREKRTRISGDVRVASSAENSTSSTYLRASSTDLMAISRACSAVFFSLWVEVDGAGGDEGVNARALGFLQGLGRALDVAGVAAGEGGDRHLAVFAADGVDSVEVALGCHGKSGFHHVHVELNQLARQSHLLGNVHAAAARLLAVAQGGVEDVNAVTHGSGLLSRWEDGNQCSAMAAIGRIYSVHHSYELLL
jgi:hypothetical protein